MAAPTRTNAPARADIDRTGLERFFRIRQRGSSVGTELRGGCVTFLTMSYILFVNPQILGGVADPSGRQLPFDQVLAVTALAAAVFTLAMGVIGRYPFAVAAGLGLNAVVAFTLVGANQLSWADAMGVIVAEGLVVTVLMLTGMRQALLNAIPADLRYAIGIGIGLFIAFIGLVNAGVVIRGDGTLVTINRDLQHWPILVFVAGLALTSVLVMRRVRGAMLLGILGSTVLATVINELSDGRVWANGVAAVPEKVVSTPNFDLVGNFSFDFIGSLGFWAALAVVLSVMLSDLFDTVGSVTALGGEGGMLDSSGRLPGVNRVLLVDSLAALGGGVASASSNTTYIESGAGIAEGARTGLASVVTGLLFLACIFVSPLAGVIPPEATAPVLVIVGVVMLQQVAKINWSSLRIAIPCFLAMLVMPATYSITNGVGAGVVFYAVLTLFSKERRQLRPLMLVVAAVFTWYFVHGAV